MNIIPRLLVIALVCGTWTLPGLAQHSGLTDAKGEYAFSKDFIMCISLGQRELSQWKQLQCQGSPVSNRYFNYAEGFSVAIQAGPQGRHGQASGPERGVSIPLSRDCTGVVVVYGNPNRLGGHVDREPVVDLSRSTSHVS